MTVQPSKMTWWYESVIDWMILNPEKNLKDCADAFEVTPTWMYTLTNSDIFKERLAERREAHSNAISLGVVEKANALADMALDAAIDKFHDVSSAPDMKLSTAMNTAEKAFELAGIGGKARVPAGNPMFVQNNFIPAEASTLEAARQRILQRQSEAPAPALPELKNVTPATEET